MGREVFIVIQEGTYRHAVVGTFLDVDEAFRAADLSVLEESDHYHDCVVLSVIIGGNLHDEVELGRSSWCRKHGIFRGYEGEYRCPVCCES